jgi:hypothetical protein
MRTLVRALIVVWFASAAAAFAQPAIPPEVQIYKTATCGCCSRWADHMEDAGFRVRVQDVTDLAPYKGKGGVPASLEACHTAFVGGYVIEGHVPAEAVKRLLQEKPKIAGLVVPGMPIGSPGMEMGSRKEPYAILALDKDGKTSVYERR